MTKLLCYALKARFFNALTANSSDCSIKVLSSSVKVSSCSNQILGTCASRHMPTDPRHLNCLRSICRSLSCTKILSWPPSAKEKGHFWTRPSTKSHKKRVAFQVPSDDEVDDEELAEIIRDR